MELCRVDPDIEPSVSSLRAYEWMELFRWRRGLWYRWGKKGKKKGGKDSDEESIYEYVSTSTSVNDPKGLGMLAGVYDVGFPS